MISVASTSVVRLILLSVGAMQSVSHVISVGGGVMMMMKWAMSFGCLPDKIFLLECPTNMMQSTDDTEHSPEQLQTGVEVPPEETKPPSPKGRHKRSEKQKEVFKMVQEKRRQMNEERRKEREAEKETEKELKRREREMAKQRKAYHEAVAKARAWVGDDDHDDDDGEEELITAASIELDVDDLVARLAKELRPVVTPGPPVFNRDPAIKAQAPPRPTIRFV